MRSGDPDATYQDLGEAATLTFSDAPTEHLERDPASARFDVRDELGRGGIGRVLRAWDRGLEREVAIKTLIRTSAASRARFARETRITARLQHPNIVPVYEGGHDGDGMPFFSMRLVNGRSLTQAITDAGDVEGRLRLLPHVIDACNAVAYAHSHGVTHRDLKPDNILVGPYGETLVIDWGLAKDLVTQDDVTEEYGAPASSGASGSVTREGSVVGTPAYMPPEQAVGRPLDLRADVYSLGAVLYHTLAGRRPYFNADDTLAAVVEGPPDPLSQVARGTPPDLIAVVTKAMARSPGDRYPDATELAAELERFQAGRFVAAHDYTPAERVRSLVRRNPLSAALAGALAAMAVVSVAALAQAWWIAERRGDEAEAARQVAEDLRDADRERLDAVTLDQARLLVAKDPGQALSLLATLSDERSFDGDVRTVAAAAFAEQPGLRLAPPTPTASLQGVGWFEGEIVALWDGEAHLYPKGHRPEPTGVLATSLAYTGEALLLCGDAGIDVWTPNDRRRHAPFQAPCALPPISDSALVFASFDGELAFFDRGGTERRRWDAGVNVVERVEAVYGGAMLVASDHGRLWRVDAATGEVADVVTAQRMTYGIADDPLAPQAVLLGTDPAATHLSWRDGERIATPLPVDASWLEAGVFIGSRVAMIGGGPLLYVHDLDAVHTRRLTLPTNARSIRRIDDHRVAVGLDDGHIHLIDIDTDARTVLSGLDEPVRFLVLSPDGEALVAGGRNRLIQHAIQRRDGAIVAQVGGRITTLAIDGPGAWWASTANGVFWHTDGVTTRVDERAAGQAVRCGGSWWAGGLDDDVFEVGGERRVPARGPVYHVACAPDGDRLIASTGSGELLIIDPSTGAALHRHVVEGSAGASEIRFNAAGVGLFTSGDAWVLPPDTLEPVRRHHYPRAASRATWWGETPVVATLGGEVWLGDQRLAQLLDVVSVVEAVDGGLLLGDAQGTLTFRRGPGAPAERLPGHRNYIHVAAGRPGGRFVATGGWDDTIWLWDLSTSPPAGRALRGHQDAVTALVWTPDGRTLLSGDRSGVVRAWFDPLSTEPDALRRQVEAHARAIAEGRPIAASLTEH